MCDVWSDELVELRILASIEMMADGLPVEGLGVENMIPSFRVLTSAISPQCVRDLKLHRVSSVDELCIRPGCHYSNVVGKVIYRCNSQATRAHVGRAIKKCGSPELVKHAERAMATYRGAFGYRNPGSLKFY